MAMFYTERYRDRCHIFPVSVRLDCIVNYSRIITAVVLTLCFFSSSCFAEIYKYVDRNGKVTYTDRKRHSAFMKLEKTWKGWDIPSKQSYSKNFKANKARVKSLIADTATEVGLAQHIIYSVIHAESLFNPLAESHAGAAGLMQLMPATAERYGVSDRFNPRQNIRGGSRYLKDLLALFNNDMELALAAYNAGEQTVIRYGNKIPPYRETQQYVKKVLSLFKTYEDKSPLTVAVND
ncbi:Membrane-bound lytic murein transglycosylase F [Thalassocella blandensis]|nr:Membrane-bound lytic murein transglycosylase F [Thalassocella blandensis]